MGNGNGARGRSDAQVSVVETTDIAVSAFYLMHGLELLHARKERGKRSRNFRFSFLDPNNIAEELRFKWLNSKVRKYDNAMRDLRKMVHEQRGKENSRHRPAT